MQLPLICRIVGIHGGGDDVGETHVRDETPALFHLQQRLAAVLPFRDAHLAGQHAGFDADERQRLGERERGAHLLAVFARLERRGGGDVFCALLRRAALVNRREAEIAREAAGGRAGIHPRQFKRDERQHEIFRPGDEPALFRVQKRGGDAAFVVVLEQAVFLRRPLVRIAPAGGDEPGDRPARHAARGLHEHVQVRNGRRSAT